MESLLTSHYTTYMINSGKRSTDYPDLNTRPFLHQSNWSSETAREVKKKCKRYLSVKLQSTSNIYPLISHLKSLQSLNLFSHNNNNLETKDLRSSSNLVLLLLLHCYGKSILLVATAWLTVHNCSKALQVLRLTPWVLLAF